ncbi:hypothetical protein J2W56_005502 [Nocardia kruczakiae]|uniref:Lipoprotein LprG n=1 Tax=Nocardia kruczakiae TaxID=261477 RepID=A0ABU1XMF8_9NOCA|nr:hypothetical protein [Nocardia kruczakiae]MDR7171741.1 hypothetical protein [Nocardia kruczakiae]
MITIGAASVAVVMCPTGAGVAGAAEDLPAVGTEITKSMAAPDSALLVRGEESYKVAFTGALSQRVQADPDDPDNSVRLKNTGFKVAGTAEVETDDGFVVTLEMNDVDTEANSTLKRVGQSPAVYEETDTISFRAVIESGDEPLVLVSKAPMVLTAQLTQFPPDKVRYQLQSPVDLVDLENPDQVVAQLETFPVECGTA